MSTATKKYDYVDITLAVGFLATLVTVCAMSYSGAEVPTILENLMWALGFGLGVKKVPQTL